MPVALCRSSLRGTETELAYQGGRTRARYARSGAAVAEYLAMGGYAAYVWSAFGFTLLVMVGLLAQSWLAARRRERELDELRAALRSSRGERRPATARPLVARREGAAEITSGVRENA